MQPIKFNVFDLIACQSRFDAVDFSQNLKGPAGAAVGRPVGGLNIFTPAKLPFRNIIYDRF